MFAESKSHSNDSGAQRIHVFCESIYSYTSFISEPNAAPSTIINFFPGIELLLYRAVIIFDFPLAEMQGIFFCFASSEKKSYPELESSVMIQDGLMGENSETSPYR